MKSDTEMLDEVMVVAFGTAKKSAFTGSAKVVGTEKLEQSQVTNVTDALAGAVPGVTLTSNDGAPGSKSSIKIRGFSSINAKNDPLIIVDGAPYSGDINNINPNDVESMTVLKDAASNALYGARGANGVIIITTKRANMSGEAKVTFDAKWGANTRALQKYEVIDNPGMYYEMHYRAMNNYYKSTGMNDQAAWLEANKNLFGSNGGLGYNVYTVPDGQFLIGQNGKLNPNATLGRVVNYKGRDYLLTPDDWEDVGMRTGLRQEYNFSVSAANEKSSFYVSLGYLGNEGITEGSDLKRLTGRLKADYQAKKWLKIGGNMGYARFDSNSLSNNGTSSSTGNIWAFVTQMAPIYPAYVRNADGSIMVDNNGIGMMDYGSGINAGMQRPFIADANPILDNKLNTRNSEGNAINGNAFVDITPIEGLKVTFNGAFNLDETRHSYVYNPYYGQFDSTGGTVSKYHTRTYDYNLQQLVSYARSFGDNNFDILLGHEYYDYRYYELGASKSQMFSQGNKELDGAIIDGQGASSYKERRNNEGFFGRLQYNYDERIFGSASLRRDASSRFHPDHRWGTFWSLGFMYNVKSTDWLKDMKWLSTAQIAVSTGTSGNSEIPNYYHLALVSGGANYDNTAGFSPSQSGNEELGWESTWANNFALRLGFLDRINFSFEAYYKRTSNMLMRVPESYTVTGEGYRWKNVGVMANKGIELSADGDVIRTRDFTWNVSANVSYNQNRLKELYNGVTEYVNSTTGLKYVVGHSVSEFFLNRYAGVNPANGEQLWYDKNGNVTNEFRESDKVMTGKTYDAPWMGGFGTSFRWKGLQLSAQFSWIGTRYVINNDRYFEESGVTFGTAYNQSNRLLYDRWKQPGDITDIPRWGEVTQLDDRFLENASFLRLKNLSLSYSLPQSLLRKTNFFSMVRIYGQAQNLFTVTGFNGLDPEVSSNIYQAQYPASRQFTLGVELQF